MTNTFVDSQLGDILVNPAWLNALMAQQTMSGAAYAYKTNATASAIVLGAADISGGAQMTILALTAAITTAQNAQLPTVAALAALLNGVAAGQSYRLRVTNPNGTGVGVFTITTNTGWTLSGAMTVPTAGFRDFLVTFNTPTTATLQAIS